MTPWQHLDDNFRILEFVPLSLSFLLSVSLVEEEYHKCYFLKRAVFGMFLIFSCSSFIRMPDRSFLCERAKTLKMDSCLTNFILVQFLSNDFCIVLENTINKKLSKLFYFPNIGFGSLMIALAAIIMLGIMLSCQQCQIRGNKSKKLKFQKVLNQLITLDSLSSYS